MKQEPLQSPLLFETNRVWRTYLGGAVLDRLEGRSDPKDSHFPEDWIASTTLARNPQPAGPHEGMSVCTVEGSRCLFADLIQAEPAFYLGKPHVQAFGTEPRILVKYLDAAVRLHIQVHPTAEFSRRHLNSAHGKAEAYYILSVRPDTNPHLWIGFQRPPSREQLREWVLRQDLENLRAAFDPIAVRPGDCLHIPGGIPHAIGAGICMVELMEPSDWVVRCEFEHNGYVLPESARYLNGDAELSLACFDLAPRSVQQVKEQLFVQPRLVSDLSPNAQLETLIDSDQTSAFRMRRLMAGPGELELPGGEAFVGLVVDGDAQIGEVKCPTGSRLFFPAGVGSWRVSAGAAGLTLLQCLPPVPPAC